MVTTRSGLRRRKETSDEMSPSIESHDTTARKQGYCYASGSPSRASSNVSLTSLGEDSQQDSDASESTVTACGTLPSGPSLHRADSIHEGVSSILCPKRRFATASSLPWGHRPHPILGASCFLFALPVPLLAPCHPLAAAMFSIVTVSSFMSDHVYTGLDSYAHLLDKAVAPLTFASALPVVYSTGGPYWASSCLLAIACHILAHSAAKRGEYGTFVVFHTLWHVVGVSLMLLCFWANDTAAECLVEGAGL